MIHGVGINDAGYPVTINEGHKQVWLCPIYGRWKKIIERCYSERYKRLHPTYRDCTASNDWLTFSNFHKWMSAQDYKEKDLDKDVLSPGNKLYSAETCVFIEQGLNKLLIGSDASRGEYPQGVSFDKHHEKFSASMNIHNRMKMIGRYNTPQEASLAYNHAKSAHIMSVAREQTDLRIRAGLMLHAVDRYYAVV